MVSALLLAAMLPLALAQSGLDAGIQSAGISATFPSDPDFAAQSQSFNLRFDYQPAAVAYPSSAEQVAQLVQLGAQNNVSVSARSGGHSYIALGVGGKSGALIVDLRNMKQISVDPTTNVAVIETGNHLGDIALALNDAGRALPHGSCPFVGVGGHVSLGGWGFASRQWGMTLDHVVQIDAVLANGTQVSVTSESYPDLFFAMRGAGSSFGIITAFHFATEAAPPSATTYDYLFELTVDQAIAAFGHFQEFVNSGIPAALGAEVTLGKGNGQGQVAYHYNGAYFGSADSFNATVQPYLDTFPVAPSSTKVSPGSYIQALQNLANGQNLNTTLDGHDYTDTFYVKSLMTPQDAPLNNASIAAFMNYLGNQGYNSDTAWFVQVETYGGSNSKINTVASDATAFTHRDKLFTIQFYASSSNYSPPYAADGISFVSGMVSSITDNEADDWNYGAYINYVDSELTSEQDHELYYGANYARLSQLKSQYDPDNVFNFPTAIQGDGSNNNGGGSASASAGPSSTSDPSAPSNSANPSGSNNNAVDSSSGASALSTSAAVVLLSLAALAFSI